MQLSLSFLVSQAAHQLWFVTSGIYLTFCIFTQFLRIWTIVTFSSYFTDLPKLHIFSILTDFEYYIGSGSLLRSSATSLSLFGYSNSYSLYYGFELIFVFELIHGFEQFSDFALFSGTFLLTYYNHGLELRHLSHCNERE